MWTSLVKSRFASSDIVNAECQRCSWGRCPGCPTQMRVGSWYSLHWAVDKSNPTDRMTVKTIPYTVDLLPLPQTLDGEEFSVWGLNSHLVININTVFNLCSALILTILNIPPAVCYAVRPFVPVNEVGILVAENTTSAVEVILSVGSYMAGRSLNNGNFPGVPARPFRSTSAPAPNNTHATWIMACCNGQDIKMVELQIGVRAGSAFVMATGAGYYRTACNLNASIVNSGWLDRTSMDIATCITCMDYGIHSLALFAPGKFPTS
eukprot:364589-Chlamydomonas_euryale.AAC.8